MTDRTIRLLESARTDIRALEAWLATIDGADPERWRRRIADALERLARFDVGRPSKVSGAREMTVPGMPYVVVYRIEGDELLVLGVFHTRQDRGR